MSAVLRILKCGPGTTLQDAGRFGFLRYGVTPAGPMDWTALTIANRLARNADDMAAIEFGPGGLSLAAEGETLRIGLAAPGFAVSRSGQSLPDCASLLLQPGTVLTIKAGLAGSFGMLAIAGGLDVVPVMGSASTHLRSAIGPLGGGALAAGQDLPVRASRPMSGEGEFAVRNPLLEGPVRFVPGPQDDYFTAQAHQRLAEEVFRLSPDSDRMGYRLTGPLLTHSRGHDIVSDGIALGAMQVPGDGRLIVLMADRQPTGGYPKIGTVIRADLPRLAQMRPGDPVRFAAVSVDEAVAALRDAHARVEALLADRQPLRAGPDLAALMSGDHASGMHRAE